MNAPRVPVTGGGLGEQRSWQDRDKRYVAAGFAVAAVVSVNAFIVMLFLHQPKRRDFRLGAWFGIVVPWTLYAIFVSRG